MVTVLLAAFAFLSLKTELPGRCNSLPASVAPGPALTAWRWDVCHRWCACSWLAAAFDGCETSCNQRHCDLGLEAVEDFQSTVEARGGSAASRPQQRTAGEAFCLFCGCALPMSAATGPRVAWFRQVA